MPKAQIKEPKTATSLWAKFFSCLLSYVSRFSHFLPLLPFALSFPSFCPSPSCKFISLLSLKSLTASSLPSFFFPYCCNNLFTSPAAASLSPLLSCLASYFLPSFFDLSSFPFFFPFWLSSFSSPSFSFYPFSPRILFLFSSPSSFFLSSLLIFFLPCFLLPSLPSFVFLGSLTSALYLSSLPLDIFHNVWPLLLSVFPSLLIYLLILSH